MRIRLTQEYDIALPSSCEGLTKEETINYLNKMYDVHGKHIIEALDADMDYVCTIVTDMNGEEVYCEDDGDGPFVSNMGADIMLTSYQVDFKKDEK